MSARGALTGEQIERLLRPIRPGRVFHKQGQSHVAGWDIAAHLTRMFGFGGWEKELLDLALVFEDQQVDDKGKTRWWVTYRCQMRLRVRDIDGVLVWESDDAASGSAQNYPSRGDAHDFAMKNAVTYALKRCAKDLGDQFGLSLYNKGQTSALVGMTLAGDPAGGEEPDVEVTGEDDDHVEPSSAPALSIAPEVGRPIEVTADPTGLFRTLLAAQDEPAQKVIKAAFVEEFGEPLSALPEHRHVEALAWLQEWVKASEPL